MTHLFLVQGTVCAGTDVLADVVVVDGAVGAMGVVAVITALLEALLSCTFVMLVLLGHPPKKSVSTESAQSAKVVIISIAFSE